MHTISDAAACGKFPEPGAVALTLIHVEGWPLALAAGDEEPRVRDLDLAERLGYANPYKIRELIARLCEAGKLPVAEVLPAVGKTPGTPGTPGRPGREFWLTEAAALKVTAKSETEIADTVLDEVIRVFMLARRGLLATSTPAPLPAAPTAAAASGRGALLAHLAEGMKLAAASGDLEAVKVTNAAVYRLLGGQRATAIGASQSPDGAAVAPLQHPSSAAAIRARLDARVLKHIAGENAQGRGQRSAKTCARAVHAHATSVQDSRARLVASGKLENRGTVARPDFWVVPAPVATEGGAA